MAITVVQTASNVGTGTSVTATFGSPVTAGNAVVVVFKNNGSFSIAPGSGGDTFIDYTGISDFLSIAYVFNSSGGYTTVTNTPGAGGNVLFVFEVSGINQIDKKIQATGNGGTGGGAYTYTSNAGTTTHAIEFWVGGAFSNSTSLGTISGASGFTNFSSLNYVDGESGGHSVAVAGYEIVSSTGTLNYTGSGATSGNTGFWDACSGSFWGLFPISANNQIVTQAVNRAATY